MPNENQTPPKPGREPDHAGVAKAREGIESAERESKEGRRAQRKRIRSGHLPGAWFVVGRRLINLENVFAVELPVEGDPAPVVTITSQGGATARIVGPEEVAEFLEEHGLSAVPAEARKEANTVRDDGRLISHKDLHAEREDRLRNPFPDHPHRANARLTDAETDKEVTARAGNAVIPPAREFADDKDKALGAGEHPPKTQTATEGQTGTSGQKSPEGEGAGKQAESKTAETGSQTSAEGAPSPEPLPFDDIPESDRTGAQKAARTRAINAREEAAKKTGKK